MSATLSVADAKPLPATGNPSAPDTQSDRIASPVYPAIHVLK
jgi:hypothetical protein